MNACFCAALTSLLLCPLGLAQTSYRIIPASHEELEGNSLSTYPLKYNDVRWQMLIDGPAIAKNQAILTGLSFRSDGSGSTTSFASKKLNLSLRLYQVPAKPSSMSKTWKNNIGTAKGTLVFKKILSLPSVKGAYPLPMPFQVQIPFASPYIYKTVGGNLLIDWQETGTYASLSWNADAVVYNTSTPAGLVSKIWENKSCTNSRMDQASLSISSTRQGALGGSIQVKFSMKPSATGKLDLMVLGLGSSNRKWGSIGLPMDLGSAGWPGCALAVNLVQLLPALTSPVTLPVPSSSSLAGLPLYLQGLAVDSKAALLVPTYNAYQVVLLPGTSPAGIAQSVYATKPSTRNGVGFMSPHYYFPVLKLLGKAFQ